MEGSGKLAIMADIWVSKYIVREKYVGDDEWMQLQGD